MRLYILLTTNNLVIRCYSTQNAILIKNCGLQAMIAENTKNKLEKVGKKLVSQVTLNCLLYLVKTISAEVNVYNVLTLWSTVLRYCSCTTNNIVC